MVSQWCYILSWCNCSINMIGLVLVLVVSGTFAAPHRYILFVNFHLPQYDFGLWTNDISSLPGKHYMYTCMTYSIHFSDHTQSAVEKFKSIVRTQVTTLWTTVDTDGDGHFESADMHHIFDDYDANRKKCLCLRHKIFYWNPNWIITIHYIWLTHRILGGKYVPIKIV